MKSLFLVICLLLLLIAPVSLKAQFHQKSSGQTAPRQMSNNLSAGAYAMPGSLKNRQIKSTAAYMVPTQISAQAGSHVKIKYSKKRPKETAVWGRAENHPDGTYTRTLSDIDHEMADNMVIQHTKRTTMDTEKDPMVLIRKITLNLMGQPDEVRIYGPPFVEDLPDQWSGQFKYLGKFVYDPMGRLLEEQINDAKGMMVRRRIQKYDVNGEPLPIETFYDDKRLPSDLKLVETGTSSLEQQKLDELNQMYNKAKGGGLFGNRKRKQAEEQAALLQQQRASQPSQRSSPVYQGTAQPAASATAAPVGGKPRFRLFKKRR